MIRPGTLALLWLTVGLGCVPDPGRTERSASEYLRVLGAEDRRPRGGPDLELLLSAPRHPAVTVRRAAVRALGRLENPSLVDRIVPSLADASPTVRAAAASALAQAVHGTSAGGGVLQSLLDRASVESEPIVRGALARSLGRLRLTRPERRRALNGVLRLGRTPDGGRPPTEAMVGVALGLESLVRGSGGDGLSSEAADRLEELLSHSEDAGLEAEAARVRSLALSALAAARRLTLELVVQGLDDPSPEVRRLAARHLDVVVPSRRVDLIRQAIHDGSPRVALEVVRFLARGPRDDERCEILLAAAAAERPPAVRVAALAALGTPCPGIDQGSALRDEAGSLDADPRAWHVPTQALRSLARVDPTAAGRLLPGYIAHPNPLVRAHAARAATALRDRQALMTLTSDPSANVRTATLEGLFELEGHGIDDLLRDQLSGDDPQLLLTAARLLGGSPGAAETATAALSAFERISEARRETWRDPRRALLELVSELGNATLADRMRPYLKDYDPMVAADVARALETWAGQPQAAASEPLAPAPLPSLAELEALERTTVTLHMRGLGPIVIRPLPHEALTNAYRFVERARGGYYDGLTFHRWEPNFVIQGGSPAANEYQGDASYTRDEIGDVSHWRGTVGSSTRGRDTGDGQIFINLADNVALDPDYTVLGVVIEGLDVVDAVLEGAVIERVEVVAGS